MRRRSSTGVLQLLCAFSVQYLDVLYCADLRRLRTAPGHVNCLQRADIVLQE